MYQVHITKQHREQLSIKQPCTEKNIKNVVKSIIFMVRLKADNELKSVMFSGK